MSDPSFNCNLTRHNWHHQLKADGWCKLPMPWIKNLNQRSVQLGRPKPNNSPYGVLDCGGGGDCFFHCVAHALSEGASCIGAYCSDDIREMLCDTINEEDYERMITNYRIMQDADDFEEDWDPHEVTTIDEFKDILRAGGGHWGDYQLLTHMTRTLRLNMVILTHDEYGGEISVYNTLQDHNVTYDTLVLLYENNCHFKLIGHFNGRRMICNFTGSELPEELLPEELLCSFA